MLHDLNSVFLKLLHFWLYFKHFSKLPFSAIISSIFVLQVSVRSSNKNLQTFILLGEIFFLVNSQSIFKYCHRRGENLIRKKLFFSAAKNFFRNKSTTRFMNSRFGFGFRCFTEIETQSIQFKQLVSTSFFSSFSIILISGEMISWLERSERGKNPKSDEIE